MSIEKCLEKATAGMAAKLEAQDAAGELLEADAARWRFVRDHLMQCSAPKMDGQHMWRFAGRSLTGETAEKAIDNYMARMEMAT